jgi:hypothetical protein
MFIRLRKKDTVILLRIADFRLRIWELSPMLNNPKLEIKIIADIISQPADWQASGI